MDQSRFFQIILLLLTFPIASCRADPLRLDVQNCSAGDPRNRQHCEEEFSRNVQSYNNTTGLAGGWRLVKTPNPNGGPEAVSVMHVSDTAKSDLSLAGLTLRCGRGNLE